MLDDANREILLLDSACTNNFVSLVGNKIVARIPQVIANSIGKP